MNTQLRDQQLQTLSEVRVVSFTANPTHVKPFGKTTLSWQVQLPPGAITLLVGASGDLTHGRPVKATGSMPTVALPTDTEFVITAKMSLASMTVGSVLVSVDAAECVPGSLAAGLFAAGVKEKIDNAFTGHLKAGGSVVKPGVDAAGNSQDGVVSINIPTDLDADFSIELSIGLGLNHTVGVSLDSVDVSGLPFGILSDALKAIMSHIVNSEMVPAIANGLQGRLVDPAAATAKQNDPQHRDFVLTSFAMTSDTISFSLCPL